MEIEILDLHRHDQYSTFDGFDSPSNLAKIAKEKGYTCLGSSNHGTTAGNIQHYFACKEVGIKPIMGVECYHEPGYNKENKQRKSYHLCLFAKTFKGYQNINKIMTLAENNKYYTARVTFDILEKHADGIICTSACIASYPSQAIIADKDEQAKKWLRKMQSMFKDDFYVEIQPYKVSEKHLQERINYKLIQLADELGIKCILTSDSHRGRKEDIDSYMKMHEVANHDSLDIYATYSERYMPDKDDMHKRFLHMHSPKSAYPVSNIRQRANEFAENITMLANKVEEDILDQIPFQMAKFNDSWTPEQTRSQLLREVIKGLKQRKKVDMNGVKLDYKKRAMHELNVIDKQGFNDYFLIVQEYVRWAKENNIIVGAGRGSVCNSLVAYALGITEVDSLKYGLDFNRFMRIGKNKIPDIDLDFDSDRRDEVIQHMLKIYPGRGSQVASYGLYKIDNLINDLVKVCGVDDAETIAYIKRYIKNTLNAKEELIPEPEPGSGYYREYEALNNQYDNIIKHFYKMHNKIRYYGSHAAGVLVTPGDISEYTALRVDKNGRWVAVHDLVDLESISGVKFDLLSLRTLNIIKDLREETGIKEFDEKWTEDKNIIDKFNKGEVNGVFQFDKDACQDILKKIDADCFTDIVAVNAMNRPGSLKLHMPDIYAEHKLNQDDLKGKIYWPYVSETYGCIVYQEQILAIAINVGGLTADEADILVKMEKSAQSRTKQVLTEKYYEAFKKKFVSNAIKKGMEEPEAADLYESMTEYTFNKGHAVGYSLTAVEEAYYLTYHPAEYFYTKIKYADSEAEQERFCAEAFVNHDIAVFIPHINHSQAHTTMMMYDGEKIIQKGLSTLKGVGEKAAEFIVNERKQNGLFRNLDDFIDRCRSQAVNKRVIDTLVENGCADVKHKQYMNRNKKYMSSLCLKKQ